jgi:hypothetical protein
MSEPTQTPDQVKFINYLIYASSVLAMVMGAVQAFGLILAAIPSFGITCLMLPFPILMGGAGYWLYTQGEPLIGPNGNQASAPDTAGWILVAMILCGSLYHCTAGVLVLLLLKNPTNRDWYQG